MAKLHVHKAVGEADLQQTLRRLRRGETPAGNDVGAENTVQHVLVSKLDSGADDAEFMIVYVRDNES